MTTIDDHITAAAAAEVAREVARRAVVAAAGTAMRLDLTRRTLHPGAGVATLACRCGRAINAADLRRDPRDLPGRTGIQRLIVCAECARNGAAS